MTDPMIRLRPIEPEDLQLLYTIENDPELWDTANTDAPYSKYALKQYIASAQPLHVCGELRMVVELDEQSASPSADNPMPQTTIAPKPHATALASNSIPHTTQAITSQPQAIGIVDLTDYSPLAARAEIGIAILREYRAKGYGKEALRQAEKLARHWRMHSLHAFVPLTNQPSWQLFAQSGFHPVAQIPDWHYARGEYQEVTFFQKIF